MIYIDIPPTTQPRKLPFYLATEEWVAAHLPASEYLFDWVVSPTVIVGRNQCTAVEADIEYCREHNIELYRRRSGGGCVYADNNNLMLSYICPSTEVVPVFAHYTSRMAQALRQLCVNVEVSGRNDLTLNGSKISGNAFYRLANRSIVHGTMLWQVDFLTMSRAITPSRAKLESHRVASVESRVTGLASALPHLTLDQLRSHITKSLCQESYTLSDSDLCQIEQIEQRYYQPAWTFGRGASATTQKAQVHRHRRIDGVGSFDITITLSSNTIADIEITGDYFLLGDLDSLALDMLRGKRLHANELGEALDGIDMSTVIAGLDTPSFISLLAE